MFSALYCVLLTSALYTLLYRVSSCGFEFALYNTPLSPFRQQKTARIFRAVFLVEMEGFEICFDQADHLP